MGNREATLSVLTKIFVVLVTVLAVLQTAMTVTFVVNTDTYKQKFADQAAETAVHDHRPVALEAMSALGRKVVHEHLKARHDVETYSEGQEPVRRLVVAPLVD